MNRSELITLEGELSRLTTPELIHLNNNSDLLGVWATAALTAAKIGKGIVGKLGKGIKKAIKKRRAKKKKGKKPVQTANAPLPAQTQKRQILPGSVPGTMPKSPVNKNLIPYAIAAGIIILMLAKKGK
jgi:hypothetical protein